MTFSISAKIQDGGQNLGNSTFFRGTTCNFSNTHRVQNCLWQENDFLEKSPVDEYVFFFFIFTKKFKISHRSRDKCVFALYAEIQDDFGVKAIFVKCHQYTLQIPWGVKNSVLILGISKSGGDPPPLHKMWGRG